MSDLEPAETPEQWLQRQFEYEFCGECGGDAEHHTVIPNFPFEGTNFARCNPFTGHTISVGDHPGVAFKAIEDDGVDWVIAVMVGDDRKQQIDRTDCRFLPRDDFCGECGQIGCEHDGLER